MFILYFVQYFWVRFTILWFYFLGWSYHTYHIAYANSFEAHGHLISKWSITGSPSDRLHSTSDRLKTHQVINYRLHLGLFKQLLNNIMIVYTSQVLGLKKYIQVPCIWGNSMLYLMYISLRNRYLTSLKITSSIPTLCDQLCQ